MKDPLSGSMFVWQSVFRNPKNGHRRDPSIICNIPMQPAMWGLRFKTTVSGQGCNENVTCRNEMPRSATLSSLGLL